MRRFEEIESGIEAVLADDGVDDFLVECRDHQPDVEFADLDPHGMLYNVASLSDDLLKDELDRRLDIQEVERGEMYITFAYYGERSPGEYADVFETILTTLDLRVGDITATRLRRLQSAASDRTVTWPRPPQRVSDGSP